MTDQFSIPSAAGEDSAAPDPAIGADRIDAYITSVEQALLAASVPVTERVQILGDLETQITEMLDREPLPISDATIEAVLARLEPASHFAAAYAAESKHFPATARLESQPYSPWILSAAYGVATFIVSCFLLLLCAAGDAIPPVSAVVLLLLIGSAIVVPIALRKGLAQIHTSPAQYRGQNLAAITAIAYWTILPLLALLVACVATEGAVLILIGLASCAYFQYIFIRRLYRRLTDQSLKPYSTRSLRDSLWRFIGLAQPAPC